MKKIIILASALLFIGAGCAKTQNQNANAPDKQKNIANESQNKSQPQNPVKEEKTHTVESNLSAEEIAAIEKALEPKSLAAGFKIYYPTFMPDKMTMNKENISVDDIKNSPDKKIVSYLLTGTTDSGAVWVNISERHDGTELDPRLLKEKKAEYFNGTIDTIKNTIGEFYNIALLTEDKTLIRMYTKKEFMDIDTFSKIAESMK